MDEQTIVGINSWVMHRQKAIFGEDAYDYRPERWMEGDKATMERDFMEVSHPRLGWRFMTDGWLMHD